MVLTLLIFISFLLLVFSAICKQTPYEKHLSDIQQEQFIKEYQSNKKLIFLIHDNILPQFLSSDQTAAPSHPPSETVSAHVPNYAQDMPF